MPTRSTNPPYLVGQKLIISNTILDLQQSTGSFHLIWSICIWHHVEAKLMRNLCTKGLGSWSKMRSPFQHNELSHNLGHKVAMQVVDRKNLNLLGEIFSQILMSPTVETNKLKCHPPHLFHSISYEVGKTNQNLAQQFSILTSIPKSL